MSAIEINSKDFLKFKRIGIALSDENRRIATPHKTIIKNNFTSFIEEIKKIIDQYNICLLYTSPSPRD